MCATVIQYGPSAVPCYAFVFHMTGIHLGPVPLQCFVLLMIGFTSFHLKLNLILAHWIEITVICNETPTQFGN